MRAGLADFVEGYMRKTADPFYKLPRWKRLRERVLRRDGYMCQEAKRYGIQAEAATVHHIFPRDEFPEYEWAPWNLISLSHDGHKAMHDPYTGKLTAAGERWRRKIPPPSTP